MTAEIVPFHKPEPEEVRRLVWVCLCGCTTFELFADGTTECSACHEPSVCQDCHQWFERLPPPPEDPQPLTAENFTVTNLNEPDHLLRRTIKALSPGDIEAFAVFMKDGTVKTTGPAFDSEERVTWLDRRLIQARDLFLKP